MTKSASTPSVAFLIPAICLAAPLFLLPIEWLLPYPAIVEEVFKAVLVLIILRISSKHLQIKVAILAGLLFALSESIFYLGNFLTQGNIPVWFVRLALTSLLHCLTFLVILVPAQKGKILIIPGLMLAILIHLLYNFLISQS